MNKDKFFKIALIIAIILLMVLVYLSFIDKTKTIKNPYYAVYLKTGDMYFGKISRFPKFVLSDIWYLQPRAEEENGIDLLKYNNAVFGPADRMEINRENIIWVSKLRDESQVVNFIEQNQNTALQNPPIGVPEEELLPIAEE
ncbi:MAG: hypothetical protein WC283_02780 [Candidatus Paceibacterota bacterium]|jgi:hypothetical protein